MDSFSVVMIVIAKDREKRSSSQSLQTVTSLRQGLIVVFSIHSLYCRANS
jgi:hypothetical protein